MASVAERAAKAWQEQTTTTSANSHGKKITEDVNAESITPSAAVAAAESSACKGNLAVSKFYEVDVVGKQSTSTVSNPKLDRRLGALLTLCEVLQSCLGSEKSEKSQITNSLFPEFPLPPGPLLSILLEPSSFSVALCVAAADCIVLAAKTFGYDSTVSNILPRLKPVFAVAAESGEDVEKLKNRDAGKISDTERIRKQSPAPVLLVANNQYLGRVDVCGYRAVREVVHDTQALEKNLKQSFWWERPSALNSPLTKRSNAVDDYLPDDYLQHSSVQHGSTFSPWSWVPGPDPSQLENDERSHESDGSRIRGSGFDDDDFEADFVDSSNDSEDPWTLRLETLTSWRVCGGNEISDKNGLNGSIVTVMSADERWIATSSGTGTADGSGVVRVWSLGGALGSGTDQSSVHTSDGSNIAPCIARHDGHKTPVTCVHFVPIECQISETTSLVVSGDNSGALHVWRLDTGGLLDVIPNTFQSTPFENNYVRSLGDAFQGWDTKAKMIATRVNKGIVSPLKGTQNGYDPDETNYEETDYSYDKTFTDAYSSRFYDSSFRSNNGSSRYATPSKRNVPYRVTSANSDMILDYLDGPELGELVGDDVFERTRNDESLMIREEKRNSLASFALEKARKKAAAGALGFLNFQNDGGGEDLTGKERQKPTQNNGYTCIAQNNSICDLFVGTGDGRLVLVDLSFAKQKGVWLCDSGTPDTHSAMRSNGISSMCFTGSMNSSNSSTPLVCTASENGHVSLLDCRTGRVVGGFAAHSGSICKIDSLDGSGAYGQLVTASSDATVKVWDLRMLVSGSSAGHSTSPSSTLSYNSVPLLNTFTGFGAPVTSMSTTHSNDAFVTAGEKLSVFSLIDGLLTQ